MDNSNNDLSYIPEIDYAATKWEPIGRRHPGAGPGGEDLMQGPPDSLCTRCIKYYKQLAQKNLVDGWPIQCRGDRAIAVDSIAPEILAQLTDEERVDVMAALDPTIWAKKYLGFESRWYQQDMLNCTSQFKVVRAGRRVGKSETMCIKILHSAYTKNGKDTNRYVILIVCPYEAQVKAIFDNLKSMIGRSPELVESFEGSSMSPWEIRWKNGSVIKGFSAAKKTSARSNKIRGQGANEVYFDEIDYMADEDIETVLAVLLDQPDTTIWMSSTPTGLRSKFWQMCIDKKKGFKEFHFISKESPRWTRHVENLMLGVYSQGGYDREFNAEFGQPMQGVFRQVDLDKARYKWDYASAKRDKNAHVVMGVDWNKHTGTHIVVLEGGILDDGTPLYKVVYKEVIRKQEFTQHEGVEAIVKLDKIWRPDFIYVDEGYGAMQIETLWRYDKLNPQLRLDYSRRLRKVNGNENVIIPNPLGGDPIKKTAKPFMIDTLAHWVELRILKIPECEDTHTAIIENELPFVNIGLLQQMRDFKIEKYSPQGQPRYSQGYEHTLMALGFAAMGMVLNFSELKQFISPVQVIYNPTSFGAEVAKEVQDAKRLGILPQTNKAQELKPARTLGTGSVGLPGLGHLHRKTNLTDLGSDKIGLPKEKNFYKAPPTGPNRTIP